jgi:uncharacterized protein YjiK
MKNTMLWATGALMVIFSWQCTEKKKKNDKTAAESKPASTASAQAGDYDFAAAEKKFLPSELTEISGINYTSDNKLAAQQDEDGIIYILNTQTGDIENTYKFGPPNDYEDIVTTAGFYYLLTSNGDIYKVDRTNPSKKATTQFKFGQRNKEFESLYLDGDQKGLVLVCKSCDGDVIDAYRFDLEKETYGESPLYSIDAASVRKKFNTGKKVFRPSAAAIHPGQKKLYIVCSIGSLVLVCNLQGEVQQVYPLDNSLYPQPEGIAFAPNGDMYISNEGGGGKGTLLKIPMLVKIGAVN